MNLKNLVACAGALALVAATAPRTQADDLMTADDVKVKAAIAATMTPEQLQAYKERVARNMNLRRELLRQSPVRTPGDTCTAATHEIGTLPYGPTADTTVGAVDNFKLPPDTVAPTCTASSTCTGAGPAGSLPRGAIYTGTGTGPDRAFRIRTSANCTLNITMDPTGAEDLGLIVYQSTCSNLLSDCVCVDDTGIGGVAESVSLQAVTGLDYFIVTDGYATGGTPPGPSGPYTLAIALSAGACTLVPVELQKFQVE